MRDAAGQGDGSHHLVDAVVDSVVELLRLVGGVDDHEPVRLLSRAVEEGVQRVAHVLADPLSGKKQNNISSGKIKVNNNISGNTNKNNRLQA